MSAKKTPGSTPPPPRVEEIHGRVVIDGWTFVERKSGFWQSVNPEGREVGSPGGLRQNVWLACGRFPSQAELVAASGKAQEVGDATVS